VYVIIDTDVLSTFCKTDRLDLLARLFRKSIVLVAPSVNKEIRKAIGDGKFHYSAPPSFSIVTLRPSERKLTKEILGRKRLGIAECECLAIARHRKCLLLTNDRQA
jgi:predicted nucleic acid-binding protein